MSTLTLSLPGVAHDDTGREAGRETRSREGLRGRKSDPGKRAHFYFPRVEKKFSSRGK